MVHLAGRFFKGPMLQAALLISILHGSAMANCGEHARAVDPGLFPVASGAVASGTMSSVTVLASRKLTIQLSTPEGRVKLYGLAAARPDAPLHSFYCQGSGATPAQGSLTLRVTRVPLGGPIAVRITNVGHRGESALNYRIFGDLSPDWSLTADDLVRRRLSVFIFENAPLASQARAHVEEAVRIWRSVGIDFQPTYKEFKGDDVARLLGSNRKLSVSLGPLTERDGEWEDRDRVQSLKPTKNSIAVIFARTDLDGFGGTRADANRVQAYVDGDILVPPQPLGRTVAHEIGHLLLGEGHTGNPGVRSTSGLMVKGGDSDSTSISEEDAKVARSRARLLPAP